MGQSQPFFEFIIAKLYNLNFDERIDDQIGHCVIFVVSTSGVNLATGGSQVWFAPLLLDFEKLE